MPGRMCVSQPFRQFDRYKAQVTVEGVFVACDECDLILRINFSVAHKNEFLALCSHNLHLCATALLPVGSIAWTSKNSEIYKNNIFL